MTDDLYARRRVTHPTGGVSMTKQETADETEINTMLENYLKHGQEMPLNNGTPVYGDFSSGADYHLQRTRLAQGQQFFESLDSDVRDAFDNDLGKFLDASEEQLLELGVLQEEIPIKPAPPQPAAPAPGETPPATGDPNTP